MNKHNVAHPYNEILSGHKKEWSIDACYNADEAQKHHANGMKLDTPKKHTLHDSLYMKYPEWANPYRK